MKERAISAWVGGKVRYFRPDQIIKTWSRGKYKNCIKVRFIDKIEVIEKQNIREEKTHEAIS